MSGEHTADVLDEWQTGAGLIPGSALVGGVGGGFSASRQQVFLGLAGFLAGGIPAFLLLSYVLYGG